MAPSIDKLLFTAASGFVEAADRRAFLEFACKGDPVRLKQLEELLAIQRDAEEFFELQPEVGGPPETGGGEGEGNLGASIGPYRLIDRLGAGGCGVVYLAEQQVPVKRRVALKIIRLGMDTEKVIARFSLEREALALMDHPNIARVLDAGVTASGLPYFVMELVDGERITDFCDHHRLGLRQRLELFTSICEAIQHAHQKGVIHRDIKPSNVLVREHDGRAVPKVIDFGIAKATGAGMDVDGTVTNFGQFIGTPSYMSPEQAEGGRDIDTRSDIFSLGVLLYELLTGRPPFDEELLKDRGVEEIRGILRDGVSEVPSLRLRKAPPETLGEIAGHRSVDPQRLSSLLAGDLDWIVMKAIDPERQRRYETANGLAMDVQRYLIEQPVLARPPSRRYLLTKLVRRNRVTFAAASIAVFGLLGGLAVSTWLFVREREARQEQARLREMAELATANEVRLRRDAKAVDLVAQAAVHLKYEQIEQMDAVLAAVTAEQVPRSLEAVRVFERAANWHLTNKRWKTASDRFYVLGHVMCAVDMKDREDISFNFLPFLTAVSEWGDPGQYDQLRILTLQRFGNSANIIVAEHITKGTLLEPADVEILKSVRPLAKVLEESFEGDNKETRTHMIAWRQFSLGLMAFREGRLDEAAEWARQSLVKDNTSDPRKVSNQLILAMIDLKQGNAEAAGTEISKLRGEVDNWFMGPFVITNPDKTLWYNQVAVRVLLREAEKMVAEKSR
ncbi:MAG: serine/threonine protein kinase [Verrucomicrobiaceae bacterium]|nr:MAG: serine/threonine protein kinase [Verrucomicrobiaceae bacterium]